MKILQRFAAVVEEGRSFCSWDHLQSNCGENRGALDVVFYQCFSRWRAEASRTSLLGESLFQYAVVPSFLSTLAQNQREVLPLMPHGWIPAIVPLHTVGLLNLRTPNMFYFVFFLKTCNCFGCIFFFWTEILCMICFCLPFLFVCLHACMLIFLRYFCVTSGTNQRSCSGSQKL